MMFSFLSFGAIAVPLLLAAFELTDLLPCCILMLLPITFGLFLRTVHLVKPAEKLVLVDLFGGTPEVLSAGLHFRPSLFLKALSPSQTGFKAFGRFPAAESRVQIDPKATQIHTADEIAATADVSVECVVRDWSPAAIIRDGGCIQKRSATIINQWLSEQMAKLSADECTYGKVNTFLNREDAVDSLNAMLAAGFTYLAAHHIVIDPDGIKMSHKWIQQREEIHQKRQLLCEREKVVEKERCLARLERETTQEAADFEIAAQKKRIMAELENNKLTLQHEMYATSQRAAKELEAARARAEMEDTREASRVQSMIQCGLTSEQCTRMAVARTHFETMAGSSGTNYVSVPPGLLGLTSLASTGLTSLASTVQQVQSQLP
jgi:hypothetical protein